MTNFKQRFLIASTVALLAGTSVSAMARGGEGCDGQRGDMSGPRAEKMQQRMADMHAKRQADLKAKLKLGAEQEASWNAFTAATQMPKMDPKDRPNPADMAKLTTPERIDKMQAMKAQRDAHMTQRAEATKTFYSGLNAEQKKVFDEETAKGRGDKQHGGKHRGGPGMNG